MVNLVRISMLVAVVFSAGVAMAQADSATASYTALLSDYVTHGKVNYKDMCEDDRLDEYISYLAATDPETFKDTDRELAFWINAYNAYTLKIICDNYPVKSINDLHFGGLIVGAVLKKTIWDKKFAVVGGKELSLNHIEHEIVRPRYEDARAHFALVCASKSCPSLRSEAFVGERLDEQLDDQARRFFGETDKNIFDIENRKARLSKILDWYEDDFGGSKREVLRYVTDFLPDKLADNIRGAIDEWEVDYTSYDWALNE